MEIIAFALPFVVAIFLLIFFRKETTWFEYVLLIVPSLLVFIITRLIMVSVNTSDTEYLGDYIIKVRHYDEWDEWVHRTCTRTYKVGNTTRTQTYDCSYRRYHPEKWTYFNSKGKEYPVYYKEDFELIKNKFGTSATFVDMKRRYYRIDGDAQDYYWNKTEHTAYSVTEPHTYKNKIQSSKSIFGFEEISKKQAHELGLYDYPYIEHNDQLPVLSDSIAIDDKSIDAVKYVNGFYGSKYQFRLYILTFPYDKGIEISELQRSYWVGGNKNELVVCLGMKDKTTVGWCNAFCWSDSPKLELLTEQYFTEKDSLDLTSYTKYIRSCIERGDWQRKEFSDFDYIRSEPSGIQNIVLLIIVLLYNIGISIYIVVNDFKIRKIGSEYVTIY